VPSPSVSASHREFVAHAARLRELALAFHPLAEQYRKLMAEMIMLQAFYLFESAMESIAAKLCCGGRYADGVRPFLLHASTSVEDALNNMRAFGRQHPKGILKWNKSDEMNGNLRYLMDSTDHYRTTCRHHSGRLNEMRIVRNHIAHANASTRREYVLVVGRRLGGVPARLPSPGLFVQRQIAPSTTILIEYIATMTAIVRDVARV
jgi:hypothetical protein